MDNIIEELETVDNNEDIVETLDSGRNMFTPINSESIENLEENNEDLLLNDENNTELINNEESLNDVNENIEENKDNIESIEEIENTEVVDSNENNVDTEVIINNDSEVNNIDENISKEVINENNEEIENTETILNNEDNNIEENIPEEVVSENSEVIENNDVTENSNVLENNPVEVNENNESLLEKYGENFSAKEYVCNPAIGRDNEIKQLILILLTPEKSGILVGKPGIGKTAIVEGLGYQIQKGNIPDALKKYKIYKLNTASLLGVMPGTNEPKIQMLLNEVKERDDLILFIDEIHTLIGSTASNNSSSMDFANIFKPGLDRGAIKIIGATTSDEYDKYILTDKAFVRRFQKVDVLEPTKEHTVKILMGSLPKLESKTGAKLKYTPFVQEQIMKFIVDLTSEYRRVYEVGARYPDVSLTILQQAFSYAVFDNKNEVSIRDIRKAIYNTKLVYKDVITKELVRFNQEFSDIYRMETVQRLRVN